MKPKSQIILLGLALASIAREAHESSLMGKRLAVQVHPTQNSQKPKVVKKSKKSFKPNTQYKSTKPIKSKGTNQFRNKSNI